MEDGEAAITTRAYGRFQLFHVKVQDFLPYSIPVHYFLQTIELTLYPK
jgi:hypothetical protein